MTPRFEAVLRTPFAGPWRRFANPVRIVSARRADEVRRALADIDGAVEEGLYAAGFVAYEAGAAFGLPVHEPSGSLPLVVVGLFAADDVETLSRLPAGGAAEIGEWRPSVDSEAYMRAIAAIKRRIEAGDTYQINFTFRLSATFRGDPKALMIDLYRAQAGRWSAFIDLDTHAICSASPELFVLSEHGRLESHPMKGTAARGWWPTQDLERGRALHRSEKNRAENVMIVDMVRNDIGRIARTGSVRAESMFDVERYPLQWQMTSRVAADTKRVALAEIFAAMFPAASVTGAPKHSSMGIIRELESTPRAVYTGAIGYLSPNGRGHFNVAIRTAVVDKEGSAAEFGVGSGVVWDSVDRDEYDECLIKAAMICGRGRISTVRVPSYATGEQPDFRLVETVGWNPETGFALLDRHLARLSESAQCFGFACDLSELRIVLEDAAGDLTVPSRVRLLLGHDGSIVCEASDIGEAFERPLRAALAVDPVDAADVFLYHKTTRREVYERARAGRPGAEAVILWNTAGEITEATDYNVVVEVDEMKVTPPVVCGLLGGTLRAELLDAGEILERRIGVEELRDAGSGWLINSVRGWVPFKLSARG